MSHGKEPVALQLQDLCDQKFRHVIKISVGHMCLQNDALMTITAQSMISKTKLFAELKTFARSGS